MGGGLKIFCFDLTHKNFSKKKEKEKMEMDLGPPATSETLLPVTLVKRLKAIRKGPGKFNSIIAGFDNGPLIT